MVTSYQEYDVHKFIGLILPNFKIYYKATGIRSVGTGIKTDI